MGPHNGCLHRGPKWRSYGSAQRDFYKIKPCQQARSQDLEKRGGGYFERVRSVQTTLTRIFIDLESVSDGLSENWDEISRKARKLQGIFRRKLGGLQKKKGLHRFWEWFFGRNPKFSRFFCPKTGGLQKKKGLHRFWEWFFGRNPKFSRFFCPKTGGLQKKRGLHRFWEWFFGRNQIFKRLRGGCFPMGGLFSIFRKKSASKPPKRCDFAYFTSQWGARAPPPPPSYATACQCIEIMAEMQCSRNLYKNKNILLHDIRNAFSSPVLAVVFAILTLQKHTCVLFNHRLREFFLVVYYFFLSLWFLCRNTRWAVLSSDPSLPCGWNNLKSHQR